MYDKDLEVSAQTAWIPVQFTEMRKTEKAMDLGSSVQP